MLASGRFIYHLETARYIVSGAMVNLKRVAVIIIDFIALVMVYLNRAYRYGWMVSAFIAYGMCAVMFKMMRAPMYLSATTPDGENVVVSGVSNGRVDSVKLLAAVTVFLKWFDWNLKDLRWFLLKTSGVDMTSALAITYSVPSCLEFRSMLVNLETLRHPVTTRPYLYGDFTLADSEADTISTPINQTMPKVDSPTAINEVGRADDQSYGDPGTSSGLLCETNTASVEDTDTSTY